MVINSNMTLKKTYSMLQIKPKQKTEITSEIKKLEDETLINFQNSKANNTVRAYRSDFKDFELFCIKNGFKALPAQPKIVS